MFKKLKNLDSFSRNIAIVFAGSTILNVLGLLYQLLIAHRLSPEEFAAFNALLAVFMLVSSPLNTLQLAVAKYSAQFSAHNQPAKIKFFFSDLFRKLLIFCASTSVIFILASFFLLPALKITSPASGYILAFLIASSWFLPFLTGGVQGLEHFKWLTASNIASGLAKLALAFIFIRLGFNISGALGALFISNIIGMFILYYPLRKFISFRAAKEEVNYKEIFIYLIPVALVNFCFISLSTSDMALVKYFFSEQDAGVYSLAQMVGKIFLFLPGAISLVMFPRASSLHARNMETRSTLKRALCYTAALCVIAVITYNLFPVFILKVLTGKAGPESVLLGRLFSLSMSFFTLSFILINYFLSIKRLKFIKYLSVSLLLQVAAIWLFHSSLLQVQLIICANAILLFLFLVSDTKLDLYLIRI